MNFPIIQKFIYFGKQLKSQLGESYIWFFLDFNFSYSFGIIIVICIGS